MCLGIEHAFGYIVQLIACGWGWISSVLSSRLLDTRRPPVPRVDWRRHLIHVIVLMRYLAIKKF